MKGDQHHQEENEEEEDVEVEVEALLEEEESSDNHHPAKTVIRSANGSLFKLCLGFFLQATALVCVLGFVWNNRDPIMTKNFKAASNNNNITNSTTSDIDSGLPVAPVVVVVPTTKSHAEIVAEQITNYRRQGSNNKNNNSLLVNVHITHHGGTAFCSEIGQHVRHPSFACMGVKPDNHVPSDYPEDHPWSHNMTTKRVDYISQYFDMISWEFTRAPNPALADTNWEDPNLVSVIIMRDPISRLLAGDGYTLHQYPGVANGGASLEEWWRYAHDDKNTNNYALKILAGNNCCNGNYTEPIHLENAKALISRFTYVLDIECLVEGMQMIVDQLGLNLTIPERSKNRAKKNHKVSSRERIGYEEVYDYLREKNRLDIELYEWSKTISLINCSAIA